MLLRPKRRSSSRILARDGETPTIVRLGEVRSPWHDLYHQLLTLSWPAFVLLLAMAYLAINTLGSVGLTPALCPSFARGRDEHPQRSGIASYAF